MISIQGITKQFGTKVIFEDADANFHHRSRVALVGPNGAGKSTLIKMILGMEYPDTGLITKGTHLAIGYLPQDLPKISNRTVLNEVMRLDGRREDLLEAKSELESLFVSETDTEKLTEPLERYARVMEELEMLDEYRLESRAKTILNGMGFREEDWHRVLTEFSGGWLMRVALCRILLMDPDLLLLDEPTNHLDLESLLWLEDFLSRYRGAILVISHDTAFLNRVVTEVLEVDQRKLWSYAGNLDAYVVQKEERLKVLRAQYAGQQEKIADIEAFVARFGAKATKARQAQSRLKQLEKMELIELPDEQSSVRFRFPPAPHSGKEVITAKAAGMQFGEKRVLRGLDWTIRRGTRTAIVGVNGAGKTTLLRLISKQLEPSSGEVKLGHEVKIGYYAQMQAETLVPSNTVLQELEQVAPDMQMSKVRAIAGAFLFTGDAVEKKCGVLSGGEKARVALAKLLLSPSNFLILDEPTNHLDIQSRGVLLEALQDYNGTLCLVSHDREFMGPLVDSVLEIQPSPQGSEVIQLLGSYEDYLQRKLAEISQSTQLSSGRPGENAVVKNKRVEEVTTPVEKPRSGPSNNQKRAWEKERDALEKEIERLEARQIEITVGLGDEATYSDKTKTLALLNEQRDVEKRLSVAMGRWEELCSGLG